MRDCRLRGWAVLLGAAGVLLGLLTQSWAKVLASGSSVTLTGTTAAATPELAGVVLEDKLLDFAIRNSAGAVIFKGKLQDRVVRSKKTGRLHFYHYIRNTTPGLPGAIASVSRAKFDKFRTDVDFRLDGLGSIGPVGAVRSGDGNLVQFIFAGHPGWGDRPVRSGSESRFFYAATDATKYARSGQTIIYATDGSRVGLTTYAPIG